jgi:DnaJ-class molecular chaperone
MLKITDNTINQVPCDNCKGKGYVIITVKDPVIVNKDKKQKCIKCGGTGVENNGE